MQKDEKRTRPERRVMETQPADLMDANRKKLDTALTALHEIAIKGDDWSRQRADVALRSIELGHW